jgi:hypothetical protein
MDFGPASYVATAQARYDYDGDGVTGSLADEVAGLIGQKVTFETDGGSLDQDVFTVNRMPLRDPTVSYRPRTARRAAPRPGERVLDLVSTPGRGPTSPG